MDIPIEIINSTPTWRVFVFSYPYKRFGLRFNSVSKFYANFISGNQVLGNKSNRQFFKDDILGGIYYYYLTEDFGSINFIFCFEYTTLDKEAFTTSNVKLRLKKILNTQVEVYTPESIGEKLKTLMNTPATNLFQRFGNQLKNPTSR
jgi:hypothetical protein